MRIAGSRKATLLVTLHCVALATFALSGWEAVAVGRCADPTISGTAESERLEGTPRNDVIFAKGGDDTIFGMGGEDVICGGRGADEVHGGTGNDRMFGGGGRDALQGGADSDHLFGEAGDDYLFGGEQGTDRDFARFDGAGIGMIIDFRAGTAEARPLEPGEERPHRDLGRDVFTEIEGAHGGDYDDFFRSDGRSSGESPVPNIFIGKGGTDTVSYFTSRAGVRIDLREGTYRGGSAAHDQMSNIENVTGSNYPDTLSGDASANVLNGLRGNDVIAGRDGPDLLRGGRGADQLDGGAGRDDCAGQLGDDRLTRCE